MPQQRTLTVKKGQKTYTRTLTSQTTEFTCQSCRRKTHREHFPGPTPKYCAMCAPIVRAEKNAERQATYREKRDTALMLETLIALTSATEDARR